MMCQCDKPGYCESLGRNMSEARWRECHTKPAYCEMFHREAAAGKYGGTPKPYTPPKRRDRGLGDTISRLLKRWFLLKPKPGCGCPRRQRRLNEAVPYNWAAWKWRLLWPVYWLLRRR